MEEVEKNLREMRAPRHERDTAGSQTVSKQEPVNQISGKQTRKPNVICCFCCGAPGHRVAECKYGDKTCRTCGRKGHLAKVCKSSGMRQLGNQRRQSLRQSKQIRQVEDDTSGESSDSLGRS